MNRVGDQFPMRDAIASQLVRHYLPRFTTVIFERPLEKALSSRAVPSGLQKHIDHVSVLINSSLQLLLLTLDLHEHFVDEKCISKSLMSTRQKLDVFRSKLITPETNRRIAHLNTSFCQQIFDISMTKIQPIV